MDIATIVDKFGLPVGLLLYFIWRDYQTSKEHKADLKDVANKAVQAIDKSTDGLNESREVIEKSTLQMSENSNILNRVIGVLSTKNRDQRNGNGN